jgi:NAD(P)-dependent dehydrogenase (short-subunit alcohol dehydrogenase family)
VVTGASRGIGFAIARRLSQLGANIGVCSRDAHQLAQAATELEREGAKVLAIAADLTQTAEIKTFVTRVEQTLGPVDILINNAGIGHFGPVQDATEEQWDEVLDTNLKAVFLMTKAVAKGMILRKTGHIVNIASLAGKNAFAGGAVYCASKWGLMGLTECAAEDLRAHGIRVSAVCPGSVATDFSPHAAKDPRKMLQPQDVAHVVEMILTQEPQSFISEVLLRPTQKP